MVTLTHDTKCELSEVDVMLKNDEKGATVKTLVKGGYFPKGTTGRIVTGARVEGTSMLAYCVQTDQSIKGLVEGLKTEWFLERDLKNI